MDKPRRLTDIDLSEIYESYCGNGEFDLTRENFNILIAEHNNLVEVVNMIMLQVYRDNVDKVFEEG